MSPAERRAGATRGANATLAMAVGGRQACTRHVKSEEEEGAHARRFASSNHRARSRQLFLFVRSVQEREAGRNDHHLNALRRNSTTHDLDRCITVLDG